MWLLKLHIAFSILCLLTFVGFRTVFKDLILENGYEPSKKKAGIGSYWVFFIPLLNIAFVLMLFVMMVVKQEKLLNWAEEQKQKKAAENDEGKGN